jgi:hypothetical protein
MRSWTTHLKAPSKSNYFSSTTFQDPLPSQKTVEIEPIREKIKPGIDHNYFLLRHVTHLTMIDWTNTDGFKDLPLLPSDLECSLLENNMGEGKPLGPLLHFTGLLPFIMKNCQNFPNCWLQKQYREYPQAPWPHAFASSNKCQKKLSQQGREDKCSSIIYIADSGITTNQCNADLSKWVKNQKPDIYILDGNEKHYHFQFVLNEEMHQFFDPLPKKTMKR